MRLIHRPRAILIVFVVFLTAGTIWSDPAIGQMVPGDIAIVFDPEGTTATKIVTETLTPFKWYLLAYELQSGIRFFQYGLEYDQQVFIVGRAPLFSANAWLQEPGRECGLFARGGAVSGAGFVVLMEYTALFFEEPGEDLRICVTPAYSFDWTLNWLDSYYQHHDFTFAEIDPHDEAPAGCAVINPSGGVHIGDERRSWGAVKALYDN